MMKRILVTLGVILGLVLVALVGALFYFKSAARTRLDQTFTVQVEPIPMPFPLDAAERSAFLRARQKKAEVPAAGSAPAAVPTVDAAAPTAADPIATDPTAAPAAADGTAVAAAPSAASDTAAPAPDAARPDSAAAPGAGAAQAAASNRELEAELRQEARRRAIARGKRYLESRAGCPDCHGADLAGKTIVDSPVMGTWNAPNITRGGVTKDYDSEDWVRIVRHGVKPNGKPATMPSQDFTWFSDQEVSDIAVYIESLPPSDKVMPESVLGPVFSMLIATGKIPLGAETLDHTTPREKLPPALEPTLELGKHLGTTCVGCHGPNLSGGPIVGGDPSWPQAANLTFHETGLAGSTLADFTKTLREGTNKSGKKLHPSMPIPYTKNLSDAEVEALFVYLKSLPPAPHGSR